MTDLPMSSRYIAVKEWFALSKLMKQWSKKAMKIYELHGENDEFLELVYDLRRLAYSMEEVS